MKAQLKFLELYLSNEKEAKARKIDLKADVIVFEGESTSGKSSIIKSIFFVLGAEVKKLPFWIRKETRILLKFKIDASIFYIYRFRDYLSLFDENQQLIFTISNDEQYKMAEFLSSALNLKIRLDSNTEPKTQFLSPAHIFSLFYIDQDSGWQNVLSSFHHTDYLKNWKHHLVSYCVGLSEAAELEAGDRIENMRKEVQDLRKQLDAKRQESIEFNKKHPRMIFSFNIKDFADEVLELETRSTELLNKETKLKEELQDKFSEKAYIETILQLFSDLQKKLENTITQAITLQEDFRCPTCGNHTDNALKVALDKAQELQNQTVQAEDFLNKLSKIKKEIANKEQMISELRNQEEEIEKILSTKKQKISLKDIISEEGKKLQADVLSQEIVSLSHQVKVKEQDIAKYEKAQKDNKDKTEQANIMKTYKQFMELLAQQLEISFTDKETVNILPSFRSNMGSEGARAVLAYFLSILALSKRCQQAPSLPIVIDTPFFQDPDERSKDKILQTIEKYSQISSQLILSTSTIKQLFTEAKVYHMDKNDKYNVLKKEEMPKVKQYMEPFSKAHIRQLMSLQSQLFEDTVIE